MLPHINLKEDGPLRGLDEAIARQEAQGGYIIQYNRMWSALAVSQTQVRVEHVPYGQSRTLPGLKHALFSLLLGIWSPAGLLIAPMFLILNLRGGMDVTADYSDTPVDPMRHLPPTPGQGERDLKAAQWIFVGCGIAFLVWVFWWASKR